MLFCNICYTQSFHTARKILVTFEILQVLLTFSLSKCRILLNFLFLLLFAIFVTQSFLIARKILVTSAIFAKFAISSILF